MNRGSKLLSSNIQSSLFPIRGYKSWRAASESRCHILVVPCYKCCCIVTNACLHLAAISRGQKWEFVSGFSWKGIWLCQRSCGGCRLGVFSSALFSATVQGAVQLAWPTASCLRQNTNFQNGALEESVES